MESTPPLDATERLKAWALAAGFDRVGVARLLPAAHGGAFVRWLERGDQASMGYLERRVEARLDPRRLFSGAKSALCVALDYAPLCEPEIAGDLWPRVARYARGGDYHELMGERLAALAERIRVEFPEVVCRWYVDTGPVLERELAAQAGLGAVGKHTNLLNRRGSWFLLGELFLDLDLTPDQPIADLCGHCTRCLEACPTGALTAPYQLDSRRCISYWTIEHRGPLPHAARPLVDDWVFGCDLCQEVCPWNAKAPDLIRPELALPDHRRELDLIGLLGLGRDDYVERFRGSPMKRAKREGLRRNAALAMGNRGEERYVPALVTALRDEDPVVRGHSAWALGRLGGAAAHAALTAALRVEAVAAVLLEIELALEEMGEGGGAAAPPPGVG